MARVAIILSIEGKDEDALDVINTLLDNGVVQDPINEHDCEAGPLHVRVAVVRKLPEVPDAQSCKAFVEDALHACVEYDQSTEEG